MGVPMVLLYVKEDRQREKLSEVCRLMQIRVKAVRPEEYLQMIAALADDEPRTDAVYTGEAFAEDMFVMVHFREQLLNAFLNMLRVRKIRPVALKAVMTPTNAHWDSLQLYEGIRMEHEAMQKRRKGNA